MIGSMRVLNITGGISTNASQQTARRLKHYFSNFDITCGIFESSNPEFTRVARSRGIETEFFGSRVTDRFEAISLLPGRGYLNASRHALRTRSEYDLVHVYGGPLFHGPVGVVHALANQSPLVTRFNGYVPLPESTVKRTAVKTTIRYLLDSTRVVFNSHAQKDDILDSYDASDASHINVIPPGVDQRWFEPVEDQSSVSLPSRVSDATAVIGSALTPRPVKRLDRAFEALSGVAERHDVVYVILGDSAYADRYRDLAEQKGVADRVYWAGQKDQDELAEWYSLFDVTILTSEWESFGMSLTESYLCGTPCVAFDVGGMSDQIVSGTTGYLVEPYDVDEFADAIEDLIVDPETASEFGFCGRDYVRDRFTLERVQEQYGRMTSEIVN